MDELLHDSFLNRLQNLARDKASEYQNNTPFPNIYFDNFLPEAALEAALRDFPEPRELRWREFEDRNQKKLSFEAVEQLPASLRNILYFLNSRPMLQFLEVLTGIRGLISDPYYVGGGLHQIRPGGHLEVHADFNWHEALRLDRRINVLLYLNKDWRDEYGGHFELWNRDMTLAVRKILPIFNRRAIFSTSDYSYHGHPTPLTCPPTRTRKSIATYYYSNGRPEEEVSESHSTLFQHRHGVAPAADPLATRIARSLVPSILMKAYRRRRARGNNRHNRGIS